jgi:hypothetical protein
VGRKLQARSLIRSNKVMFAVRSDKCGVEMRERRLRLCTFIVDKVSRAGFQDAAGT